MFQPIGADPRIRPKEGEGPLAPTFLLFMRPLLKRLRVETARVISKVNRLLLMKVRRDFEGSLIPSNRNSKDSAKDPNGHDTPSLIQKFRRNIKPVVSIENHVSEIREIYRSLVSEGKISYKI